MESLHRLFDPLPVLAKKSLFLFGPRQTGKSTLIRQDLKNHKVYNLLNSQTFVDLSSNLQKIRQGLSEKDKIIVIDEIQKLPQLLDEVHLMIEEHGIKFFLTGSSPRKLRRGGYNLLGGRAWSRTLHPLTYKELGKNFRLDKALHSGLLPSLYLSDSPDNDLKAYVGEYLKEEVAAEAHVRNIPAFSRFLEVAGLCHTKMLNYTNIANDAQVPRSTVMEYFEILKDTLIAHELLPFQKTIKRKPLSTSKFYFFDSGIVRFLQKRGRLSPSTPEWGDAFEGYIFHELKTYLDYTGDGSLHYWRSTSGFEVDFILNENVAIEVKAKRNPGPQEFKNLKALAEEKKLKKYILVCLIDEPAKVDGITVLPWKIFLEELWAGKWTHSFQLK